MEIEQLPFASTAFGRQVIAITRSLRSAADAARSAYTLTRRASVLSPQQTQAEAQKLVQRVLRFGQAARSAPVSPAEMNLGMWKPYNGTHTVNEAATAALRSQEARRAKTTSGAGQEPLSMAPMPEITLGAIADAQRLAHRTGWVNRKCDIDERYRRDDSHVKGVDRKLRGWCYKAPLRVRARSSSALSGLVAAGVRAALDQIDGLTSSVGELGVVASAGFGCAELVWRDCFLSVPIGGGRSLKVPSEIVSSLEQVYPRNFAFDIIDDRAFLCLGANQHVEVCQPGLQKFLFVRGDEPGPARFRGYGWANAWLSYLAGLTLEKFGTLIEVFGLSTPFLQRSQDGYLSDEEHDHALSILAKLGTGDPEVIPARYGEIKHSPVPAGLAPLHTQMLGYCRTEQSKLILGSTLSVEIGSNGSYAAADVHADGVVDTQRIYATLIGEALRSQVVRWLLEVNAPIWAAAFSRYVPGGCSPEDVVAELPIVEWILSDETPAQRMAIFQGVKNLGYALDEEQVRTECRVLAPLGSQPAPTFSLAVPSPEPEPVSSPAVAPTNAPIEEKANGDEDAASPSAAEKLAAEMTEHGIDACEHGAKNRCRLCGVERRRGVVPAGPNGEPAGWKLEWAAIQKETPNGSP